MLLGNNIDPPQLRMGAMVIYYACIIHINLPLESLYLLKKSQENLLRSFKDLSIQRDIGTEKLASASGFACVPVR
uniref:SFRICE_016470 n=1 Tax=Spodoptera frugiperda TaxID=7108 RepID=A0A2H1VNG2_SPOFR